MDPSPKRPKLEVVEENNSENARQATQEQEEGLIALVEHRRHELQHLTKKFENIKAQKPIFSENLCCGEQNYPCYADLKSAVNLSCLEEAQRKLSDAESQLAQVQKSQQKSQEVSRTFISDGTATKVKTERLSPSPARAEQSALRAAPQSRPQLVIPAVTPKMGPSMRSAESSKVLSTSGGRTVASGRGQSQSETPSNSHAVPVCIKLFSILSILVDGLIFSRVTVFVNLIKLLFSNSLSLHDLWHVLAVRREHVDLISDIRSNRTPTIVRFQTGSLIASQHKRKLRSLVMNPTSEQLFATSAFLSSWADKSGLTPMMFYSQREVAVFLENKGSNFIPWNKVRLVMLWSLELLVVDYSTDSTIECYKTAIVRFWKHFTVYITFLNLVKEVELVVLSIVEALGADLRSFPQSDICTGATVPLSCINIHPSVDQNPSK
eukprot:Gb_24607 [translate_table: standard]